MTLRPISKTDEDIEDVVAALLAAGNGLDVTYDDENGTLTVDVSQNAIGTGELSFETATQDELDAVESSAADARTDLRFALFPEEVDASTRDSYYQNFAKFADSAAMTSIAASSVVMDEVSTSSTAMDAVSTSQTAMDAVSTSQTAMDAVSTSSTAMDAVSTSSTAMDAVSVSDTALDAIWQSQTAWDIVKAKSMAVGKFAAGRAGLNGADYADVDAVASSQTAMDAVSTSSTARDAIGTDGVGYDAVAAVAMAIGKYAAGIAGLDPTAYADIDAVASDANAMDAVSTSSTAMDAVSASLIARTAAFHSDYSVSSLWASSPGAKTILESGGSPTLPETFDDPRSSSSGTTIRIEDGTDISLPGNATSALEIEVTDSDDPYRRGLTLDLDLSDASTLEFDDRADGVPSSGPKHGVEVGGDTLVSKSGGNSWTTRSVDVSAYNGTQPVLFFTDTGTYESGAWDTYFGNINLI